MCSANAAAGNTIYSAFVRQFGVNCARPVSEPPPETVEKLDADGKNVDWHTRTTLLLHSRDRMRRF